MGGIGKTSLAAAYVAQEYNNYNHIVWISNNSADIADDFVQDIELLISLELHDQTGSRDEIFYNVSKALRSIEESPNLMVIDNAGVNITYRLAQLPSKPCWHVLVTAREKIAGMYPMQVDFLKPPDAIKLFKKHCWRFRDDKEIKAIVETVDYHTLTIEILARTAQLHRTTFFDLLNAIKNNVRANIPTGHSNQAKIERVRTYLETIFNFSDLDENERWLLKQFVALPPEFQSYELLVELIEPEQSDRADVFSELLENLAGKGWLLRDAERDSYKMHRVVREAIQAKLQITPQDIESLLTNVTRKLRIDQTRDNPVDKFAWIPYGEAIEALVGQYEVQSVSLLQDKLGWIMREFGDYARAKSLHERALASDEKNLGANHPDVAVACGNLAGVLKDLGDYAGAKVLLERALASAEQSLGADHPVTAVRCSNLATVLQDLGDYAGAKVLLERALASAEQHLGAEHPTTAVRRSNLALVLQDLGDYADAKVLLERALASVEKNFGADHPSTAVSCSNLAMVLQALGDYAGAKVLLEHALASDEQNFGADHPSTAVSCSNLALVLQDLGDYAGAKDLFERTLDINQIHFGADHPSMAVSCSNLASVLQDLGDYAGAKHLLERALAINEKHLGADHPSTAASCSNLASLLFVLNDYDRAWELIERTLSIQEKAFGIDHPSTALTFSNMAAMLEKLSELEKALSLASKALSVFENKLPSGHPHTEMAQQQVSNLQAKIEAQNQM